MNWHDVRVGLIGPETIRRVHADRLLGRTDTRVGTRGATTRSNILSEAGETGTDGAETDETVRTSYEDVDAVIVATPHQDHEAHAVAALDAGVPILLETSPVHALEAAGRVAEAARWSSGFCMVGFGHRYVNAVEVINALRRTGRVGAIQHIDVTESHRHDVPKRESRGPDTSGSDGGALAEAGVRGLDLAAYVLEFPRIAEVTASSRSSFAARRRTRGIDARESKTDPDGGDDSVTAFIRTTDDTTVSLDVTGATCPSGAALAIRGTNADVLFECETDTLTLHERGTKGIDHLASTRISTRQNDGLTAQREAFLRAVVSDEPPDQDTLEQAIAVHRIVAAIERSARSKRTIRLAEPTRADSKPRGETAFEARGRHPDSHAQESTGAPPRSIAGFSSPGPPERNHHEGSLDTDGEQIATRPRNLGPRTSSSDD